MNEVVAETAKVHPLFELVIGLEIHAQISTQSKLFCGCSNQSFGKPPNSNVCPICMGFPGMLPATNSEAVHKGLLTALALQCELPSFSKFDRKNYFYPDLPLGFQISQYDEPVSVNGSVKIELGQRTKTVRIRRLHLENDAGKLTHVAGGSLIDFNRAGCPLMEIVTEPDLRSAEEAVAFAKAIQILLRYVGSSEADMEKGMMRFDASVSTRKHGEETLYPRAEIKNLNSFKALENAINYEFKRQIELREKGTPVEGDTTVGWVEDKQKTILLRDKEGAADYRYFPEPDIPPLTLDPKTLESLKKEVPELPLAKRRRFIEQYTLSEVEATFFCDDIALANTFETVAKMSQDPAKAASFVGNILVARMKERGKWIDQCKISPKNLAQLIQRVNEGVISNNTAKTTVFDAMFETGQTADQIIESQGLKQVSNTDALEAIVDQILRENESAVNDYRAGKQNAFGFLVGQAMKASKGQANPQMVNDLLKKKLTS